MMRTRTRHRICLASFYGVIALVVGAMFFEPFQQQMGKLFGIVWTALGKLFGLAMVAFGITGCSTVSYTVTTPLYETSLQQTEVANMVKKPIASSVAPLPAPKTALRYGRFIVEVGDNLHEIQGGVFTPPKSMSVSSIAAHVLVSNYSTKELVYYRKTKTGSYEPIIGYAVVTPKPEELPTAQVRGKVTRIIRDPSWCPGPKARKKDPTLPAGCLPPGHKDNAMGAAKMVIKWQGVKGFTAIHIHGTGGYSTDGAFWNEDTLGCTRLLDSAILALIDLLGPQATKEGIEVILERGNTLQNHAL